MKKQLLTLLLGTNLGDRKSNILKALEMLSAEMGSSYVNITQIIETEAVGFVAPPFLNTIVRYFSDKEPLDVLKICKKIERQMGRQEQLEYDECGKRIYHDRIIDIDILYYGDYLIDTKELVIPHPQVETRPFVKLLMQEAGCCETCCK